MSPTGREWRTGPLPYLRDLVLVDVNLEGGFLAAQREALSFELSCNILFTNSLFRFSARELELTDLKSQQRERLGLACSVPG